MGAPYARETCAMADSSTIYRVTVRLTPEIYAQLEAQGRSGNPLAAIVRDALVAYLSRQPATPQSFAELATPMVAWPLERGV